MSCRVYSVGWMVFYVVAFAFEFIATLMKVFIYVHTHKHICLLTSFENQGTQQPEASHVMKVL